MFVFHDFLRYQQFTQVGGGGGSFCLIQRCGSQSLVFVLQYLFLPFLHQPRWTSKISFHFCFFRLTGTSWKISWNPGSRLRRYRENLILNPSLSFSANRSSFLHLTSSILTTSSFRTTSSFLSIILLSGILATDKPTFHSQFRLMQPKVVAQICSAWPHRSTITPLEEIQATMATTATRPNHPHHQWTSSLPRTNIQNRITMMIQLARLGT